MYHQRLLDVATRLELIYQPRTHLQPKEESEDSSSSSAGKPASGSSELTVRPWNERLQEAGMQGMMAPQVRSVMELRRAHHPAVEANTPGLLAVHQREMVRRSLGAAHKSWDVWDRGGQTHGKMGGACDRGGTMVGMYGRVHEGM